MAKRTIGMNIGGRIREIRKNQGMLQETLAHKVGVNTVTLSYWENGKREVKISMLEKIAVALNAPLELFYQSAPAASNTEPADPPAALRAPVIPYDQLARYAVQRTLDNETPDDYLAITELDSRGRNVNDLFWVIAEEPLMSPSIEPNDQLLLVATDVAYKGDIVCVTFNDQPIMTTIQWFTVQNGGYCLVPENPNFPPTPLMGRNFRIVAKVIKIVRVTVAPKKEFPDE